MAVSRVALVLFLAGSLVLGGGIDLDTAAVLPTGFTDTIVLSGLTTPTAMAFSSDGRIFVAEKSGLIKVFDSLSDTTATVVADLRTQVHNYHDRGLLGFALDPNFPIKPYIYVSYTRDADIGGIAPKWGSAGVSGDPCPLADDVGCTASGRLSRLRVDNGVWNNVEEVLVDGWFQQFDTHSMSGIAFGPDGALYVGGGDAASWQFVDYGQAGNPLNPGGDPPVPVGGTQTPPTAEGGALRSQDLRTSSDPLGLDGAIIRVNPDTGAPLSDNPRYLASDPNEKRVVAYGLRNPFRIAVRPGTREVWVGDVGWTDYEEINIIPDPASAIVPNFGWPCYDGTLRQPGYDAADLNLCESLYAQSGAVTFGHFQYRRHENVVSGETCGTSGGSTSGLAFYEGGNYPSTYAGALFFGDYTRNCIWVMQAGTDGKPSPGKIATFDMGASGPVDLKIGPGGDLYYVDIVNGAIHRIQYTSGNQAPRAVISATPTSGLAPLTVRFDGSGSTDPEGGTLSYEWDLDGDGAFDDGTGPSLSYTYSTNGTYAARLRVTDPGNAQGSASVSIAVGNTSPVATIDTPSATLKWQVGQTVTFSGHATDAEDGTLPASALSWSVVINHCTSSTACHEHPLQDYAGVASGSFTAPDHEYPSYLTLRLTAVDSGGLSHRVERRIDPLPVTLSFATQPSGLQIAMNSEVFATPATRTVIVGSHVSISAVTPQSLSGVSYTFASWSDGGAASHTIVAPGTATTYTATFTATAVGGFPSPWSWQDIGTHGAAGSASYSNGSAALTNAGVDIWGTADGFTYAYMPFTGDGEVVARVASLSGSETWAKAGVMIRASTAPGATHAFMLVSKGAGTAFQRRRTTDKGSENTAGPAGVAPRWVKVTRKGSTFSGYVSSDGTNWTFVGSADVTMGSSALAGVALTSHTTASTAAATFDNISGLTATGGGGTGGLPTGWTAQDIGSPAIAGSTTVSGSTFTVKGSGTDIWSSSDQFQYAYRTLSGDGTITARVATLNGTHAHTKTGVMIRASLAANAAHASMMVHATSTAGYALQYRLAAGGTTSQIQGGTGVAPEWVRVTRSGTRVTGYLSSDGVNWTTVGNVTLPLGTTAYFGLALTNHDATALATATFDGVTAGAP